MILFWSIISLMTLLAMGCIALPMLSRNRSIPQSETQIHIDIFQQRKQEIEAEYASGNINANDYAALITELQRNLLENVPENTVATLESSQRKSYVLVVISLCVIPLAAISLYRYWGSSGELVAWYTAQQQAAAIKAMQTQLGTPERVIEALQKRLQQDPQSAQGWYLLGRVYFSLEQFAAAETAFAKAKALQPNNTKILLQYAQALYFTNSQKMTPQIKQFVEQVLNIESDNDEAINFLAVAAYQQKQYREAIALWEKLLAKYPADTDSGKIILQALARAQTALEQGKTPAKKTLLVKLQVRVQLADNLKSRVTANDSVFIYAKAAQGPRMPLAIVKKQVRDLPAVVTLDESMAMTPQLTLAQFPQVILVARISKNGKAIPAPDDLEGSSPIVNTSQSHATIDVIINRVLP